MKSIRVQLTGIRHAVFQHDEDDFRLVYTACGEKIAAVGYVGKIVPFPIDSDCKAKECSFLLRLM